MAFGFGFRWRTRPVVPVPRRRSCPIVHPGVEQLERRVALAVTEGSLGFLTLGVTEAKPQNDVNTATSFTFTNVLTTDAKTNYFKDVPRRTPVGTWSFSTVEGANASLSFVIPDYGKFQSVSLTQISNTVTPARQRAFDVLGTFSGSSTHPVTPSPVPATLTISLTQTGLSISSSATMSLPASVLTSPVLVAANDTGCDSTPLVYVIDPVTGKAKSFNPYPDSPGFRGGVRVAVGDVFIDPNARNVPEIICAPGPGRVGEIRVFTLAGTELPQFRYRPFGNSYVRGIDVAVGDLDGVGSDDLVSGASRGPGSVNVASSSATGFRRLPAKSFTAFGGTYTGGAAVAVGAVGQILVGSGIGMAPLVKTYDVSAAKPRVIGRFAPSVPAGTGGVTLTTQYFTAGNIPQVMVAGGRNADSAIGVYNTDANPASKIFNPFATRANPNSPVYSASAALASVFADTVFTAQGVGGTGTILKLNAKTGAVDRSFVATLDGKPIVSPLRIATGVRR
jgi:hypothetical protein